MPDDPVPYIEDEDYDDIRALALDMPPKYDDWHAAYERDIADRRRRGHDPQPIQITPAALAEFLAGRKGDAQALLRCAVSIARTSPPNVISEYDPLSDDD